MFDINANQENNNEMETLHAFNVQSKDKIEKTVIIEKRNCIKESLKQSIFKMDPSSSDLMLNHLKQVNIWEYIQKQLDKNDDNSDPLKYMNAYFKFISKDKNKKKLHVKSQIIESGNQKLVVTSIKDMSSWIELQKQKQISMIKTVAFASTAHEFRNPLNAIITSISLLEGQISQSGLKYYNIARSCSNLLLNLVKDILDLSQLEGQSLILNYDDVDIVHLIDQCFGIFQYRVQEKGIQLEIVDKENFPRVLYTDGGRVLQILINLVSNAVKYTFEGFIRISGHLDFETNMMKIVIEDTGVGMDDQQVKALFQQFTKFQRNRDLNKEGVGLGLTVSKKMAKALGGDIEVISKLGEGTKFTLRLPLFNHIARPQIQSYQKSRTKLNQSRSVNLSIIDDYEVQVCNTYASKYQEVQSIKKPSLIRLLENFNFEDQENVLTRRTLSDYNDNFPEIKIISCNCPQILIVDDDPFNLMAVSGLLSQNYSVNNVDTALNGKQALEKILENNNKSECECHHPYKLVLMDNQMPIMNGLEAALQIRNLQQNKQLSKDLHIVLLSGDERLQNIDQYRNAFDYFLEKPIDQKLLEAILKTHKIL